MTRSLIALLFPVAMTAATLTNGTLTAEFDERGLKSFAGFHFTRDAFSLTVDGTSYESENLAAPRLTQSGPVIRYRYPVSDVHVEVIYELRPGWRFLSKQVKVELPMNRRAHVNRVSVFRAGVTEPVRELYPCSMESARLKTRECGGFLRFDGSRGLLALVQNPFQTVTRSINDFEISYEPDMDWESAWGPFESDRGLLAPYTLTGRKQPATMLPEWKILPLDATPGMDEAEVATYAECVRAFVLDRVPRPVNVFVGWCVNDYQIDISTPEGRAEYKRIIDRAVEMGSQYVLFAPANTAISLRAQSEDDWGWENLLWLGLGQKIRRGEWKIESDPVPDSVAEMLAYAKGKNAGMLAYVYPVLGFLAEEHPDWTVPGAKKARDSLGVRGYQDWLTDALVTFAKRTGISGYSFDHAFLDFPGTSRYAQWAGWRRVMENLRERMPEVVIDGRQAYQYYGAWSWLAGTYPHPTHTDEQPESFVPFPDLHFDRVSANRERYTAWQYRNMEFAPSELVPGFITHQTPRSNDRGDLPAKKVRDERTGLTEEIPLAFRTRDWDALGWRYSLLSSIAVAGLNNVINMIPARDPEEFRHFSAAEIAEFRGWLDWAAKNQEYLRHTRTILGQPAIGKVDGTAAMVGDRGFVFLFNPNGKRITAAFQLDTRGRFVLREVYPLAGRTIGPYEAAAKVSIAMQGTSAVVYEVSPAPSRIAEPLLYGAPGRATLEGGTLVLDGVRGEAGTRTALRVAVPAGSNVAAVRVNGQTAAFSRSGMALSIPVRFAGAFFPRSYEVRDRLRIPKRVFEQAAERRKRWPIPWTAEDRQTTWLVPERLLLFVQIAEPSDKMAVKLKLDGKDFPLEKAYASVRKHGPSFVGFYADVSRLEPDREYKVELSLPALKPGQFQGLFVDNVETEHTSEILAK
jgi:hypothetical protein